MHESPPPPPNPPPPASRARCSGRPRCPPPAPGQPPSGLPAARCAGGQTTQPGASLVPWSPGHLCASLVPWSPWCLPGPLVTLVPLWSPGHLGASLVPWPPNPDAGSGGRRACRAAWWVMEWRAWCGRGGARRPPCRGWWGARGPMPGGQGAGRPCWSTCRRPLDQRLLRPQVLWCQVGSVVGPPTPTRAPSLLPQPASPRHRSEPCPANPPFHQGSVYFGNSETGSTWPGGLDGAVGAGERAALEVTSGAPVHR